LPRAEGRRATKGANLAKPTTTQRALDRVYWEIRWMGLMDNLWTRRSPAAFSRVVIFFSSDQNAWRAKARFLVGGEGYYATPSRVLMHWGAFSGGWWAPRFWVAPLRGGWWLRHRRPEPGPADRRGRAYRRLACAPFPSAVFPTGKKISKRKALKI
jgi:hypothetical protein